MRCRPGIVANSEPGTVPDQRCIVSRLRAHAAPHPGNKLTCNESTVRDRTLASIDHLVGQREQLVWNCQIERLGGLTIEYKLEFGGLYDWQVRRLRALEDARGV